MNQCCFSHFLTGPSYSFRVAYATAKQNRKVATFTNIVVLSDMSGLLVFHAPSNVKTIGNVQCKADRICYQEMNIFLDLPETLLPASIATMRGNMAMIANDSYIPIQDAPIHRQCAALTTRR